MRFSHSSKLGALLCPKTIQITADPNCFIFSMILSALWCPNTCRKLKLIAIFVFGNDSDCCSVARNKHFPLIKHPSGHGESVSFLQPPFHPPFIYWQCVLFATGKNVQTKQETGKTQGKENSSKELVCHCWNFFFFSLHTLCDRAAQYVSRVSGTETKQGCFTWDLEQKKWPNPFYCVFGLYFSNKCPDALAFLWEKWLWTPPSHFSFLGYFHFIKLQSMCFVCGEEGLTHTVVVSVAVYIGGSSSPRIRPLCAVKR